MISRKKFDRKKGDVLTRDENEKTEARLYLFLSFDLVNSTEYKTLTNDWPAVFSHFYFDVEQKCKDDLCCKIWKYAGDEVLLYHRVESQKLFYEFPFKTYNILENLIGRLNKNPRKTKTSLSVKATMWVADVKYYSLWKTDSSLADRPEIANIFFSKKLYRHNNGATIDLETDIDFLGPDIDIGFRLSNYSRRGKLAACSNFAYLLWRKAVNQKKTSMPISAIGDHMKIVAYEQLKGIWNDRRYPIIWFDKHWEKTEDMFLYDEEYYSDIVKQIKRGGKQPDHLSYIDKIYRDVGRKHDIERIGAYIDSLPEENPNIAVVTTGKPPEEI